MRNVTRNVTSVEIVTLVKLPRDFVGTASKKGLQQRASTSVVRQFRLYNT